MKATTVRVDDKTKRELDRVQGLVQAETGARVTYADLLARLLRIARRHESELLADTEPLWSPPTPAQLKRLLSRARDWGVATDASRIDDVLYGGSPHE